MTPRSVRGLRAPRRGRRLQPRWCIATALCAVTFAKSSPAAASPSARLVYLRGAGADDCPDEQALRAAVGSRLGYDPFFPWAPATVFAEIVRAGGAWHAEVKLVDADNRLRGSRDLRVASGDCAAAIDAMALSISLAIDPTSLLGPPKPAAPPSEPEPAPAAAPPPEPPAPVPPIPAEPAPSPPPQPPETVHVDAGLGVLTAVGAAPAPDVGANVFVGARIAWVSVTLEARADLTSGAPEGGAYVRSSLLAGSIVPCAHAGLFFGCGVLTAGDLRATSAVAAPRDQDALYLGIGGRGGVGLPLGGAWSLRLHLEVLATTTPTALQIDGANVFNYAPVSADAGAAIAVRFR